MKESKQKVIIVGAGLCGLTLAWLLQRKGVEALVLEGRDRLGGRILTARESGVPLEMGATWLGMKHKHLMLLIEALNLTVFPQQLGNEAIYEPISTSPPQLVQLPPNEAPSYRIAGGTSKLISSLSGKLSSDQLRLNTSVHRIEVLPQGGFRLATSQGPFVCEKLVTTLPPHLLVQRIKVAPSWDHNWAALARQTHTWMDDSIKVGLCYHQPFWRESGRSGTIFSNFGPIPEMYDHSNHEDNVHALVGFLNSAYAGADQAQRLEVVLQQLHRYYGSVVREYLHYEEKCWKHDPYTWEPYEHPVLPHQNNGHKQYREPYRPGWWVAGSETAPSFPGYMDGAVESAMLVADQW